MAYNDNFEYPAEESLVVDGIVFDVVIHPDHAPLKYRREELGLSQQQVATAAGINLRQYQRLESGERKMSSSSMRIGLSICRVLMLDPYRFVDLPTSD